MFSTLRRLFILAVSAVVSGLLFAPVAFAVNEDTGAAGGPNPGTVTHHASGGSSLAAWEWTLISVGIVVVVALIVGAALTLHRRSHRAAALQPQMP
jgi:anti-sigma-K factor RskA